MKTISLCSSVLALFSIAGGCATLNESSGNDCLASKVDRAMSSAGYMHIEANISHEGTDFVVLSEMTKNNLRTQIFQDDALIGALLISGDKVQEYNRLVVFDNIEYRNATIEFDKLESVEGRTSVGYMFLMNPHMSCIIGTLTESWLDHHDGLFWWQACILGGEQIADRFIDGNRCIVFQMVIAMPPYEMHTAYFNAETMLPVRWDTIRSVNGKFLRRERHYKIRVSNSVPEKSYWTLKDIAK